MEIFKGGKGALAAGRVILGSISSLRGSEDHWEWRASLIAECLIYNGHGWNTSKADITLSSLSLSISKQALPMGG